MFSRRFLTTEIISIISNSFRVGISGNAVSLGHSACLRDVVSFLPRLGVDAQDQASA